MSLPRRGTLLRAQKGERGSVLITTTGGQQLALAGLDAQALGRVLSVAMNTMTTVHCESEIKGVEGLQLAMPPKTTIRKAASGN